MINLQNCKSQTPVESYITSSVVYHLLLLFPNQWRWRHLRWLSNSGTNKALKSSRLRVDAERYSVSFLLFQNELMNYFFHLTNRTEVLFKSVIKFGISDGFKVTGINSSSRGGKTTFTHTSVISQSPFIKIRMS